MGHFPRYLNPELVYFPHQKIALDERSPHSCLLHSHCQFSCPEPTRQWMFTILSLRCLVLLFWIRNILRNIRIDSEPTIPLIHVWLLSLSIWIAIHPDTPSRRNAIECRCSLISLRCSSNIFLCLGLFLESLNQ